MKLAVAPTYGPDELNEVLAKEGKTPALAAVMQLIEEQVTDLHHAAAGPELTDAYAKWLLGGAQALLSLKADVEERTRST